MDRNEPVDVLNKGAFNAVDTKELDMNRIFQLIRDDEMGALATATPLEGQLEDGQLLDA
jgi:hypothetical protein